jgi:hypothetical protein
MEVTENTGRRLVLEDRVWKMEKGAFLAVLSLCILMVAYGLWLDGLIPGTSSYRYARAEGYHHAWFSIGFSLISLLLLWGLLARTYSRIILDQTQGHLTLLKARFTGESVIRQEPVASVRKISVDSLGDVWRLEIELESGERLLPRRVYNNAYRLDDLQKLADQANQFLDSAKVSH